MSFAGKKIVIANVDWSSLDINNIAYRLESVDSMSVGDEKNLYVWYTDEEESITVASSNSSVLSVGNSSGAGTASNPFVYKLTALDFGTVTVTITANSGTKSFQQVVSDIPSGYTRYVAIHLDDTADSTVYCPVPDIQLSYDYSYEFKLRKTVGTSNNFAIFGVRGYYKTAEQFYNTRMAFALFTNSTTGTPTGSQVGYWWNTVDTNYEFNALPMDGNMYTISVTNTSAANATFTSTYNNATVNVTTGTTAVLRWAMGFAFFNYRYENGEVGSSLAKNISIGTTIIKDSNGAILYKFIPVKDPNNKYGYYESVTKKFYGFNENTQHYDSISGEIS